MDAGNISSLLSGVMSDPEVMNKISGILSDPETMNKLSNVLSPKQENEEENKENKEESKTAVPRLRQSPEAHNRARLIAALKPYLNEDRRKKADKLMGLLTLLELSGSAELFNK